jgi:SAM-dependent methyltransferase
MALAAGLSPDWLALREPADAAARATDLVAELSRDLPTTGRLLVHDLGCGTGSMARWLAPRLRGDQHWVLHDTDAALLDRAAATAPTASADGGRLSTEVRRHDVTRMPSEQLADASLVTASALLDLLTPPQLEQLVLLCTRPGCPVLLTLSVTGRVELSPADPLDTEVAAAFDAHQRRFRSGVRLLGPDAAGVAASRFRQLGADVLVRPSPWQLGAARQALTVAWFEGWLEAACRQRPELAGAAPEYRRRRLASLAAGRLWVTVHHEDLLVRGTRR